jgi:hypothetical protein
LKKHLEPVTGHVGTLWVLECFGPFRTISERFRLFRAV